MSRVVRLRYGSLFGWSGCSELFRMPDVRPSVLRFNFLENICGSEKHIAHAVCGELDYASVVWVP